MKTYTIIKTIRREWQKDTETKSLNTPQQKSKSAKPPFLTRKWMHSNTCSVSRRPAPFSGR